MERKNENQCNLIIDIDQELKLIEAYNCYTLKNFTTELRKFLKLNDEEITDIEMNKTKYFYQALFQHPKSDEYLKCIMRVNSECKLLYSLKFFH
jgi:hypothetical protein